jgi:hypothetical protein
MSTLWPAPEEKRKLRDYLQKLAGSEDPERSVQEFERLSGTGHSRGWRFNRDEIHERS